MLDILLNKPVLPSDNEPKIILAGITIQPEHRQVNDSDKKYYFILDRSGSMAFKRIKYLKKAFQSVLDSMPVNASTSVYFFNDGFNKIFEEVSPDVMKNDFHKIENVMAYGGTEMSKPIKDIMKTGTTGEIIIALTDGESHDRNELFKAADDAGRKGIPIFSAGIGADKRNGQEILSEVSRRSGGLSEYIKQPEDIVDFLTNRIYAASSASLQGVSLKFSMMDGTKIINIAQNQPIIKMIDIPGPQEIYTHTIGAVNSVDGYEIITQLEISPKRIPGTFIIGSVSLLAGGKEIEKREIKVDYTNKQVPVYEKTSIDEAFFRAKGLKSKLSGDIETARKYYSISGDDETVRLLEIQSEGTATNEQVASLEMMTTRRPDRHFHK